MPRGSPDFGATAPRELTTPALDSGELAARLGSRNVYDRLGTVIALYTADQPIALYPEIFAASGRRDVFLAPSPFGPYVWRLTAEADGEQPGMRFDVPFIGDSPVAVEVVLRQVAAGGVIIELVADADTAATRAAGGIRWNGPITTWQFQDPSAVWQSAPSQPSDLTVAGWHSMKFTIDPATALYGRATVDGESMAVAGTAMQSPAGSVRVLRVDFFAEGTSGTTVAVDVAAVIVTVNEL